jgi:hypothetical protein
MVIVMSAAPVSAQTEGWYPFESTAAHEPGEIGMNDWLERPAGAHGRVRADGSRLVYNGRPIQLWGVNLCFAAGAAPEKAIADKRAAMYAKYGINSVRFHKFADGAGWAGILTKDSTTAYDPDGLDRFDYQVAQLKQAGIYVKLSQHFGPPKFGRKELAAYPWLKEFGEPGGDGKEHVAVPHSAIFYSPDIQDIHIAQIVNLLNHRNAYTNQTYAADPVVWDIEIVNEQSVLFHTSMEPLKRSATLRKQIGERFAKWLRERYTDHAGLVAAWGEGALGAMTNEGGAADEHLDLANILPLGNPWFWDPDNLHTSQAAKRQRLLDTLEFLTSLQREFYSRYVEAVRKTGYDGEISGSNWQAGRAYSHFANLWTDAEIGTVDRHNYFGERKGPGGTVTYPSMLGSADGALLSSGLQQVAGRPFMLSEWTHTVPNPHLVEGPALVGAYGMGLQGWDVSYAFQNRDDGGFARKIGSWSEVSSPAFLGVFPAVARQVHRGDVRPSEQVATLNVHPPSLFKGKLGFGDETQQGYDDKSFESDAVPRRALAAVRVEVALTDQPKPTTRFDLAPFQRDGMVVSSTGQLKWHEATPDRAGGGGGYVVIDTAGTQAVVGFAAGEQVQTADARIAPAGEYGAVSVTALSRDGAIAGDRRLLITAIGRSRNTGVTFDDTGKVKAGGDAPVLMEPVRAAIKLNRAGPTKLTLLDHDGKRTPKAQSVTDGVIDVDTSRDRTPYYLVEFDR